MKLAISAFLAAFLALPATAKMDLRMLDKYEGANCLDGSGKSS